MEEQSLNQSRQIVRNIIQSQFSDSESLRALDLAFSNIENQDKCLLKRLEDAIFISRKNLDRTEYLLKEVRVIFGEFAPVAKNAEVTE